MRADATWLQWCLKVRCKFRWSGRSSKDIWILILDRIIWWILMLDRIIKSIRIFLNTFIKIMMKLNDRVIRYKRRRWNRWGNSRIKVNRRNNRILGKGINEGLEEKELGGDLEKGKIVSWNITSLKMKMECVWRSNSL